MNVAERLVWVLDKFSVVCVCMGLMRVPEDVEVLISW